MQNFRLISSVVSEIDAFKETYRGAILCIFLRAHDFSQILNGCKFCTIKDRNFKFSGNAQLLVRCSAHIKMYLSRKLLKISFMLSYGYLAIIF